MLLQALNDEPSFLLLALKEGHLEVVKALLEAGGRALGMLTRDDGVSYRCGCRLSGPDRRERERGKGVEDLLTIKKRLKVGKHNALSGNTAYGRTGSSRGHRETTNSTVQSTGPGLVPPNVFRGC